MQATDEGICSALGQEEIPVSDCDGLAKEKVEQSSRLDNPPFNCDTDQIGGCDDRIVHVLGIEALSPSFSLLDSLRSEGFEASMVMASLGEIQNEFLSPYSWPLWIKAVRLWGPFMASTFAAYAAGAYALASEPLRQQWHISDVVYNIGITIFVLGFGFAPMILAPVSEAYGRYWVFVGSGVTFWLGTLGCAITSNFGGMLISRLVAGSGASVFATLTGGVVGDLFRKEDRNTPMALYSLSIMAGTGLGPLISGIVVDRLSWRWVFFVQLISIGVTTITIAIFFTETRSNVLLQRKCNALNKACQNIALTASTSLPEPSPRLRLYFQPRTEETRKVGLSLIWRSFAFPLKLLVTESVVFWFSVWVSFAWAILYMQFSSIGIVFTDVYGFSSTRVGTVYISVIIGSVLGTLLAILQEPITRRIRQRKSAHSSPEERLLPPSLQSVLLPAGLFWFGWTARSSISWISPAIALGSCTVGIFSIYLAVFNYFVDTYHQYASSALAAQSMCRNLLAGTFPLFTGAMLKNLTYKGAGSLLGGLGLVLTIIPWLLMVYGQAIRTRSPFAGVLAES